MTTKKRTVKLANKNVIVALCLVTFAAVALEVFTVVKSLMLNDEINKCAKNHIGCEKFNIINTDKDEKISNIYLQAPSPR